MASETTTIALLALGAIFLMMLGAYYYYTPSTTAPPVQINPANIVPVNPTEIKSYELSQRISALQQQIADLERSQSVLNPVDVPDLYSEYYAGYYPDWENNKPWWSPDRPPQRSDNTPEHKEILAADKAKVKDAIEIRNSIMAGGLGAGSLPAAYQGKKKK